jgi:hypothetical protein
LRAARTASAAEEIFWEDFIAWAASFTIATGFIERRLFLEALLKKTTWTMRINFVRAVMRS